MDFHTKKEISKLKSEILAKDAAVEAEKYAFERELKNGLGDEILNTLHNPPKPNLWTNIKIKYIRWRQKRNDMKEYRKIIKELNKINKDIEKELGDS